MSDNTQKSLALSDELHVDIIHTPSLLSLTFTTPQFILGKGCGLIVFSVFTNFILGLLAIVSRKNLSQSASDFFAPKSNHFGFMWLATMIIMLVGIPAYILVAMRPVRKIVIDTTSGWMKVGYRDVCKVHKIEYVTLTYAQDTDSRSLSTLQISHSDGMSVEVCETYDERKATELANLIAAHVNVGIRWEERGNFPDQMSPAVD